MTPIFSRGEFRPESSSTVLGTPIAGNDGGDSAKAGYPVNFFVAGAVSESVSVGFMATSLFGLGFRWDDGWVGRYHAGKSELLTLDFMPSVAYRPNKHWAFGAGLNVRYAHAQTRTAIDFGTIDAVSGGFLGGVPSGNDGELRTRLHDWDVGYTLGMVFEPAAGTRIGLSYRSKIRMNLDGKARFDPGGPVGQGISGFSGAFTDTDSNAPLTLPAALIFGVRQQIARDWQLVADAQWTQWSALERLRLRFSNPLQTGIDTELRWRNSWFVALGLIHQLNSSWTVRTGVAYDQTPSRHATSTPAIPDARGIWLTLGGVLHCSPASKLDFVYGHIFVKNNPIALDASAPDNAFRGSLTGKIRGSAVDFFSLQYSHAF
jgi:long-chain fatty acid transport protein